MQAYAFSNNEVALIVWDTEGKIANCRGFALERINVTSKKVTPLPSWVGFDGQKNEEWEPRTTFEWPIQKFSWADYTADPGSVYCYRITPMTGTADDLVPQEHLSFTTNPTHITANRGACNAYFNRGILAAQFVTRSLPKDSNGLPDYRRLRDRIDQPGDPLRNKLAGQVLPALRSLFARARREGGQLFASLYELNDTELLSEMIGCPFLHLILSNAGDNDGTNHSARQSLHESGVHIQDRILKGNHIGHNKFVVYCDSKGKPQAVLLGSTNWTFTGLCGQANNVLIIENQDLAQQYLDYWQAMSDDDAQGADFRTSNRQRREEVELDMGSARVWFSPNTIQQNKPAKDPALPGDLEEVFRAISKAKQAVLFLVFQPGSPSIVDQVAMTAAGKPELFVRGAATDPGLPGKFEETLLFHRGNQAPDAALISAAEIKDQFSFWQKELLKSSPQAHAIIHDKIVVIDPFSEDCVVVTGSHNLGFKASYANDENLVIIRGNRALAEAYAAHVLHIYDHYRFRYKIQKEHKHTFSSLTDSDHWQDKYFSGEGRTDLQFWSSALKELAGI